jgi:Arc/MetJ-type ribon-helix-helix transcriptional regulator
MTVQLPPRIERIVNDALRSGQYRSAEDVVSEAIEKLFVERRPEGDYAVRRGQGESMGTFSTQAEAIERARELSHTDKERQAAIERLKNFGKTHQLSLGGMTIKQLRDEARP